MKWIVVFLVAAATVGKVQPRMTFGMPDFGSIDMNGDGVPDFQMGPGSGSFAKAGNTSKTRIIKYKQ